MIKYKIAFNVICYCQHYSQNLPSNCDSTRNEDVCNASVLHLETYYIVCVGRVAQSVLRLSYGLDGPGSNPVGDEIFLPSRPTLGPTQPPAKWVPGLSRG